MGYKTSVADIVGLFSPLV